MTPHKQSSVEERDMTTAHALPGFRTLYAAGYLTPRQAEMLPPLAIIDETTLAMFEHYVREATPYIDAEQVAKKPFTWCDDVKRRLANSRDTSLRAAMRSLVPEYKMDLLQNAAKLHATVNVLEARMDQIQEEARSEQQALDLDSAVAVTAHTRWMGDILNNAMGL